MRTLSRVLIAVAVGALVAPAMAGAAKTPGTHGIVVQRDAKAGSVVVATRSGKLQRVHVAKPNGIAMGSVLQVTGTKVSVVGHARKAKLHGVVVRRHRHSFALAGNGSVLAVTSPTPPTPGEQVTATVQVNPTSLDDDDGDEQVDGQNVASAEVRGTVLSQDATTLRLAVTGFPSGLAIGLGGKTIPTLAVGTPVEARVALGPDPANANAIVLTLVSLRVEGNQNGDDNDGEHHHGNFVKAEGIVTAVTEAGAVGFEPGSITINGEHGMVTFVIPAGFGPTGVVVGDEVEAKGTAAATPDGQPTLTRLEGKGDNGGSGNGDSGGDSGGGHSDDGSGGDD
jgi:uncharacterized membrane protein YgcG